MATETTGTAPTYNLSELVVYYTELIRTFMKSGFSLLDIGSDSFDAEIWKVHRLFIAGHFKTLGIAVANDMPKYELAFIGEHLSKAEHTEFEYVIPTYTPNPEPTCEVQPETAKQIYLRCECLSSTYGVMRPGAENRTSLWEALAEIAAMHGIAFPQPPQHFEWRQIEPIPCR